MKSHCSNVFRPFVLIFLFVFCAPLSAEQDTWSLNMRDVDMQEFIDTMAKLTERTIITDERVNGKISISTHRELNRDELYELFVLQLGVNGFSLIDAGQGLLKVVPNQAAKIQGVEVQGERDIPGVSERIVTRVAKLRNINVNTVLPALRPLVDNRTGVITPFADANILILTDRESNVRRLVEVIQRMDKSDSRRSQTFRLQNASAKDLEGTLSRLIAQINKEGGQKVVLAADSRTNTIIVDGDEEARSRLAKLIGVHDSDTRSASNIRVRYLKYAKAGDMVSILQKVSESILRGEKAQGGATTGAGSEGVDVEADESINAIVLSGSPHMIRSLETVVDRLDIRRAQVLVEAMIVELSDTRARELGVQWLFRGDQDGTAPVGGVNFSSSGAGIYQVGAAAASGEEAALTALSAIEGISLGVGKIRDGAFSFAALMRALSTDTQTNILSTPSLLTLDNQEASILVGREVPVITGSTAGSTNTNPFQTISRQDIGISLKVTPQINDGDAVQLAIEQEVSSLSGLTASDIITNKRNINTSVLINDGATIVLGGLIDEDIQESESRVPILGDIPLLGHLFRSTNTQKSKRHLMVFIRPNIVRDQKLLTALSTEKYNYIRAQQLLMQGDGISLFPGKEAPVLPEWSALDASPMSVIRDATRQQEAR